MGLFDSFREEKCYLLLNDVYKYIVSASTKLNRYAFEVAQNKSYDVIETRIFYLFMITSVGFQVERNTSCKFSNVVRNANNRLLDDIKMNTLRDYEITKKDLDNLFDRRFKDYLDFLTDNDFESLLDKYIEYAIELNYPNTSQLKNGYLEYMPRIFENAVGFVVNNRRPPC
ncbi:MAG: hypothetical protein EHM79_06705 [Geobacter sp.]|nr:MAG: hypothetical protein EHM79_06705 [Geobacter sp.]